jgi:hypothetical protein
MQLGRGNRQHREARLAKDILITAYKCSTLLMRSKEYMYSPIQKRSRHNLIRRPLVETKAVPDRLGALRAVKKALGSITATTLLPIQMSDQESRNPSLASSHFQTKSDWLSTIVKLAWTQIRGERDHRLEARHDVAGIRGRMAKSGLDCDGS